MRRAMRLREAVLLTAAVIFMVILFSGGDAIVEAIVTAFE